MNYGANDFDKFLDDTVWVDLLTAKDLVKVVGTKKDELKLLVKHLDTGSEEEFHISTFLARYRRTGPSKMVRSVKRT